MKGKLLKTLAVIATSVMAVVVMPAAVKADECTHEHQFWEQDFKDDGGMECDHILVCSECKAVLKSHNNSRVFPYEDFKDGFISGYLRKEHCDTDGCDLPVYRRADQCEHEYGEGQWSTNCHTGKKELVYECKKCGRLKWETISDSSNDKKDEEKEEKKEESKPRDLNKEAFGGREASQLSVTEQKSAVSYAIDSLRASGNALAANVVTSNNGGNGKASDIAAVVADNRDAANQQIFAQVACANLGFKNVTPLATYNMYSLHSSYTAKNGAQVITWANTGLKAGDTAFVVWYNQKLGRIELLPALVDANGNVLVNVPALGDVSTMTVVKASK